MLGPGKEVQSAFKQRVPLLVSHHISPIQRRQNDACSLCGRYLDFFNQDDPLAETEI